MEKRCIPTFSSALGHLRHIYGVSDKDGSSDGDERSKQRPSSSLSSGSSSLRQAKLTGPDSYTQGHASRKRQDYRTSSRKSDGRHGYYPPPDDGYKDASERRRDEEERKVKPRSEEATHASAPSPVPSEEPRGTFKAFLHTDTTAERDYSRPEIMAVGDFPGVGLQALHSAVKSGLRVAGGSRYKRVLSADFQASLRELSPYNDLGCAVASDICIGIFARNPVKSDDEGRRSSELFFPKGSSAHSIILYCTSGIRAETAGTLVNVSVWGKLTGTGYLSGHKPVLCVVLDSAEKTEDIRKCISQFIKKHREHVHAVHFFGDGEGILVGWVHILGKLFDGVFSDL